MEIKNTQEGIIDKKNTDLVLKKHVGLIHCENKLTLIQRKICNILLFNALDHMTEQDIHEISLKKLCTLVGYNSNDSKLIKESVKTLISTVMEWNLLEDNKSLNDATYLEEAITWNASSLLAGASIRNGLIRYSYSPQMRSILASLDIYGRINLFVQAKFNSTYSLVLYENCVRFKNIEQTSWFSIDLFRSLMGIPSGKYRTFKELNRNVINVAIKEINLKSDIRIEPLFKRTGRSITTIQFLINDNENYCPSFKKNIQRITCDPVSFKPSTAMIEKLISQFGLSNKQAEKVIHNYDHPYLLEKMTLVSSKKHIKHPVAYLLSALKEDYKTPHKQITQAKGIEISYQREAKQASEITPLKNKYMEYKSNAYIHFIKEQAHSLQKTIQEKFENCLKANTQVLRIYKKSGFASPFVMADLIAFIDKHFPQILGDFLSFDDYLTSEEEC